MTSARLSLFIISLTLLPVLPVQAIDNGVYRIINAAYNRAVVEDYVNAKVTTTNNVGTSTTDWEQLWEVENISGSSYSIRNVYTGRYISNAISRSSQITMTTTQTGLTLATASYDTSGFTILGNMYAHCASSQSYWLVGWNTPENAANTFYFNKVEDVDITEARESYDNLYGEINNQSNLDTALQKYFIDRACTILKDSWSSDEALRTAMENDGLGTVFQDMAIKIKNDSWETFEKKFRIHDYEIASDAGSWVGYSRQSVQSNMSNPTGINAENKSKIYVMVDSEVPTGTTLYIAPCVGCSYLTSSNYGTELHQGLNIVPVTNNATTFFIFYCVNSYNGGNYLTLSDYPAMKIHIEGGTVDGFYTKGDGEDLYNWLVANHSHEKIRLKGSQIILDAYTSDFKAYSTAATIDDGISAWDWVLNWQYATLGLRYDKTDAVTTEYISSEGIDDIDILYPKYYNSWHLAYADHNGFMDAGSWRTHYNSSCWGGMFKMESLLFGGACSMWGVAHEIGHTNQGVFNMPGGTEVTNNLLSNITNFMSGYGDSRGNTNEDVKNYFLNEKPWYNYDIWAQTRMYYKLFLYFHAAKNDITFYPRLFNELRHDPLRFGSANSQSNPTLGENMHLKFYEKCCEIAKQDLTPFFESYGFFRPMDLLLVGDYSNHYVTSTQEMIDAAKARVKAKGYPVNTAIIFIDDRSEDVPVSGLYKARGGTGIKVDNASVPYTTGSFTHYADGAETTASGYTLSQEGRTITFAGGTGAQGFVIYDTQGNIVGFTNTDTFTFPESYTGYDVTIVAAGSDMEQAQSIEGFDPDEAVTGALRSAMESADKYLALEDTDGKHPGYYPTIVLTTLKSLYSQAESAINKSETPKYGTLTAEILEEISLIKNDLDSKTPIRANRYYRLKNYCYPTRYMTLSGTGVATNTDSDADNTANWWRFYPSGTTNQWRIASYDGHFISTISQSAQATAQVTTESDALLFNTTDNGNGTLYFCTPNGGNNGLHSASNDSYKVVGWNNSDASRWYLEEVQGEEVTLDKDALKALYQTSEALINQVAEVTYLQLQGDNSESDFYLFSNADYNKLTGNADGQSIAGLLDNNINTYFHSLYGNSGKVTEYHYIQANLGTTHALQNFSFNYATRNNASGSNKPTKIVVSGSNDGTEFTEIHTFTSTDADNPLPSTIGTGYLEWESPLIQCSAPYQYLRFTVTETNTGDKSDGYPFFTMSTFNITTQYPYYTIKTESYPKVKDEHITSIFDAITPVIQIINDVHASANDIIEAYDELNSAYITLKNLVAPEVTYEYYFNDEKKASETIAITIGESYPAPTFTVPYGVVAPTAPEGTTTGCETKRIDLCLVTDYPVAFSTGINDARWYTLFMRNSGKNGGYVHFDGTYYPELHLSSEPTTPDYLFAFVGDPWGFQILTPNNTYLHNSGGNNEKCTATAKSGATTFQLHEMSGTTPKYGKYYIDIIGKNGTFNDVNNSLGFWNHTNSYTDEGSQISFAEAKYDIYHINFGSDAPADVSVTYNGTTSTPSSISHAFVVTPPVTINDLTISEPAGYAVTSSIEGKIINLAYTPYYNVIISACGYTTFYADEPTLIPEGCEAFYVSGYDGNYEQGTLALTSAGTYVAPRQGVIIKGTEGTTYHFIQANDAVVESPASNYLIGYSVDQDAKSYELGDGWYYLSRSGRFKKLENASYSLVAHKAYLFLGKNEVKEFLINDQITGIQDTLDSLLPAPGHSCNLAGQVVEDSYKGIVIQNGRKYLNK